MSMNGEAPEGETNEVIQPQPTPMSFQIAAGYLNMDKVVILSTFSATGTHVIFLDVDSAKSIGKQLQEAATGLVLPS